MSKEKSAPGELQSQLGLKEPQTDPIGSSEQAKKFAEAFKGIMAPVNTNLNYTLVNAEQDKHKLYEDEYNSLYGQFNNALKGIDPAEEAKGQPQIDQVKTSAQDFANRAAGFKQKTETSVNAWKQKESDYDKSVTKIEELEAWGDASAKELRDASTAILNATKERKFDDALSKMNELAPKLQPVYDEYAKQKPAKEKYDEARKNIESKLQDALKSPPSDDKSRALHEPIVKSNTEIDAAVAKKDYVTANGILEKLPKALDDYQAARKAGDAKKKYEEDLKQLQPHLDDALKRTAPEPLKAKREEVVTGQKKMQSAATEGKYEEASSIVAVLSPAVEEYVKAVDEFERENPAEWAKDRKGKLQKIQDDIDALKQAVSQDVDGAIVILKEASKADEQYDHETKTAKKNFREGIKDIAEDDKLFKEVFDFAIGEAAGAATGALLTPIGKTALKVISISNKVLTIVDPATRAAKNADTPFDTAKLQEHKGADWKGLSANTQMVLDGFKSITDSLDAGARKVAGEVRWMDEIVAKPEVAANQEDRMKRVDELVYAQSEFAGYKPTMAADLAPLKEASAKLMKKASRDLEQDMAIRWIARLDSKDRDYIDKADKYLKQIGVIDQEGNRLGVDTGDWTTDNDERMVHLNAKVEFEMQSLIGQSLLWQGFIGFNGTGIAMHSGIKYHCSGPASLKELIKGNSVVCTGFSRPAMPRELDNYQNDREYLEDRRYDHTIKVQPGGDAVDGPSAQRVPEEE